MPCLRKIRRGKVESEVSELVDDVRRMMLPYTAANFKEDHKNRKLTLGVYAKNLAMPMGVSHILAFSQREERVQMRLARVPEGPTMSFRVHRFSLSKHIRATQRRPISPSGLYQHSPIVVTNNFGDATNAPPHIKLMRISFQNMFPAINVATVKLSDCRRVVLFNYIPAADDDDDDENKNRKEEDVVEVRHYAIKATPVGVNKKVRRLVQTKIPNLRRIDDIADYITGTTALGGIAPPASSGNVSDSEPEDETSHVVLSQRYAGRGNHQQQKSALKLVELGPRMALKLIKVERGLGGGDVMYHAFIHKTPEEARELKARKEKEAQLKNQRRQTQERNVEQKRKAKEEKRERKRQRKEAQEQAAMEELRKGSATMDVLSDDHDDEVQYEESLEE